MSSFDGTVCDASAGPEAKSVSKMQAFYVFVLFYFMLLILFFISQNAEGVWLCFLQPTAVQSAVQASVSLSRCMPS